LTALATNTTVMVEMQSCTACSSLMCLRKCMWGDVVFKSTQKPYRDTANLPCAVLCCALQEDSNRKANQERLGQLGLMQLLVALSVPGAPSAAVRAQVGQLGIIYEPLHGAGDLLGWEQYAENECIKLQVFCWATQLALAVQSPAVLTPTTATAHIRVGWSDAHGCVSGCQNGNAWGFST
jgi:hypothetical protein